MEQHYTLSRGARESRASGRDRISPVHSDVEDLRHLFEQAQDIIYRCDAEGCFTAFNPTAVRLMEYRPEELIGRPYLSLIRDDWRRRTHIFYQRQFRDRTPGTYFEFAAATKSGRTVWLGQHVTLAIDDEVITGFHAIARDITARRVAEERLQQSEARYRSLVQGAGYGIYRSNERGDLLDVNPAFVRMLGYDSAEDVLAIKTPDLYTDPSLRARLIGQLDHSQSGRIDNTEVEWRRRDGSTVFVRLSGRIVPPAEPSQPTEYEVIVEDVSQRRIFEDQLRQAQKIEAVGQLAGGIAHNFNNLLTAVLGYTELLLQRHPAGEDHDDLEEVYKSAQRGSVLTRQLLAFSRKQVPRPRDVDAARKVAELEAMMAGLVRENITLQCDVPVDPVIVRVDPGEFEEMVINLVLNARDAMPSGGTIRIVVDRVTGSQAPGLEPGRYVRMRVEDTGVGMGPDVRAHLFEPFFTTKEQGKGIGLGLASVYGIVRQCRGAITADSEPGRGSTFAVYLPDAGAARDEAAARPSRAAAEDSARPGTVLLVEDEDSVRVVARTILAKEGYQVFDAASPGDACRIFKEHRHEIDLLLTDVVMPEMSGPVLAEYLVGQQPGLRVLYMSGLGDGEGGAPASQDGGNMVLTKPFRATALTAAVRDALAEVPR